MPDPNSLKGAAARRGRYYGAAVQLGQVQGDRAFREAVLRDCSHLTPEIHLKWDVLEAERGRWNFGPADQLTRFADAHRMNVRGHTLLWDLSTPAWAKEALLETRDWRIVSDYFAAVLPRYEGRVGDWDVINEPLNVGDPDTLRANTFMKAFGPEYIARALKEARLHAPTARLAINDYGFDYDNWYEETRRRRLLKLVEELKSADVPLDQIGIQAHLDLSRGPVKAAVLTSFLRELADMGLEIVITELDVKENDYSAPLSVRDRRVADEVARYLEVALAEPAVRGVITWGLTDRHSWLQESEDLAPGQSNRGLPLDTAFAPKPMYWAMHASLAGAAEIAADRAGSPSRARA